jgi:hypothetical protein
MVASEFVVHIAGSGYTIAPLFSHEVRDFFWTASVIVYIMPSIGAVVRFCERREAERRRRADE